MKITSVLVPVLPVPVDHIHTLVVNDRELQEIERALHYDDRGSPINNYDLWVGIYYATGNVGLTRLRDVKGDA